MVSLRAVCAAGTGHSLARRAQRTGGLCVSLHPPPGKLLTGGVTRDTLRRSWARSTDTAWAGCQFTLHVSRMHVPDVSAVQCGAQFLLLEGSVSMGGLMHGDGGCLFSVSPPVQG